MSTPELIAGRFRVVRPLPHGNMGQVYEAIDSQTAEPVAVKTMLRRRNGDPVSLSAESKNALRFQREVRIMALLHSDRIPRLVDGGLDGDLPYLAMEFVPGTTLRDLLAERGRLPVSWAAAIGVQAAEALQVAHRASVVHRDLKPANIMIAEDGTVKVLDFGVGLILDDVDGPPLTSSGITIGTACYMAPEQARAQGITPAVDLYALGCVLYEMLIGKPPFDGESTYELMNQQVRQEPVPVRSLRSEVPEALELLVARLLAKEPADRPADADEVAAILRPAVAEFAAAAGPAAGPDPTLPVLAEHDEGAGKEDQSAAQQDGTAELQVAADAEFDIFDVHKRLITDYRAFTEGAAPIRDPRIQKFVEADLDSGSQWDSSNLK